jgi:hypothetical protein
MVQVTQVSVGPPGATTANVVPQAVATPNEIPACDDTTTSLMTVGPVAAAPF